jgi:hypothetical protein
MKTQIANRISFNSIPISLLILFLWLSSIVNTTPESKLPGFGTLIITHEMLLYKLRLLYLPKVALSWVYLKFYPFLRVMYPLPSSMADWLITAQHPTEPGIATVLISFTFHLSAYFIPVGRRDEINLLFVDSSSPSFLSENCL